MICKRLATAFGGAALLAAASIVPAIASEKVSERLTSSETEMGLLIKTPEIPHGLSFNRQMT